MPSGPLQLKMQERQLAGHSANSGWRWTNSGWWLTDKLWLVAVSGSRLTDNGYQVTPSTWHITAGPWGLSFGFPSFHNKSGAKQNTGVHVTLHITHCTKTKPPPVRLLGYSDAHHLPHAHSPHQ